jgi:hypothetical protein
VCSGETVKVSPHLRAGLQNMGGPAISTRQVALRVSKGTVLDIGDEKRETRN